MFALFPRKSALFEGGGPSAGVRRGTVLSLFTLVGIISCDPGELRLYSEDGGQPLGEGATTGTGGNPPVVSSGGTDSSPDGSGGIEMGGSASSSGASTSGMDDDPREDDKDPFPTEEDPTKPPPEEKTALPCSFTASMCQPGVYCEASQACPNAYPVCDLGIRRCVECTEDAHCVERFGEEFGVCGIFGMCLQCEHHFDCDPGKYCSYGACGECTHEVPCPSGQRCERGECVEH